MSNNSGQTTIIGDLGLSPSMMLSNVNLEMLAEMVVDKPVKRDGREVGIIIEAWVINDNVRYLAEIYDSLWRPKK